MPKGPKSEKRPSDVIGNAVHIMRMAAGEIRERPATARKAKIGGDLATMDGDERVLLVTRKLQEARTARRKAKRQGRRSTKGS